MSTLIPLASAAGLLATAVDRRSAFPLLLGV
jgi:hypothetical protein